MKHLLAIFLIWVSFFLFTCGNEAREHYNGGLAYYRQGKLDEAVAEYKKAITINPNYADEHYSLGVVYHEQGKYDLGIASYQNRNVPLQED